MNSSQVIPLCVLHLCTNHHTDSISVSEAPNVLPEAGPSSPIDTIGQGSVLQAQSATIDASSLQALVAAQRSGSQLPGSLASQQEIGAVGGRNPLLDNLLANDLQAAIRANEVANQGRLYSAIGNLSQGGVPGISIQPQSLASVAAAAAASEHRMALAAAQAQRNLALSTVPFIDAQHRNALTDGALNQLMSQQMAAQFPPHLNRSQLFGHPPSQWAVHSPSPQLLGLHPGLSADLLFARHGPAAGDLATANRSALPTTELHAYGQRDQDGIPLDLPVILALPEDHLKLSSHQVLLRHQIEAFRATEEDVSTHTRGRNKPVILNQIGIRCRHCAHLPVGKRQKGSTYFPAALLGLYQAAQNMSTTHMQCGLCSEMPVEIKQQFAHLISTKVASGAGRPHWARAAKKLGLVDTEDGIRFIRDLDSESGTKKSSGEAAEG